MKSVYRFSLALTVCLLLLAPVALLAQTTGTIEGQVTDQSGAALPGVTVELAGRQAAGHQDGGDRQPTAATVS